MGRYDNYTWVDREDFSAIRDLKFPKHELLIFWKKVLDLAETEDVKCEVKQHEEKEIQNQVDNLTIKEKHFR
jgi:hypothetical protein